MNDQITLQKTKNEVQEFEKEVAVYARRPWNKGLTKETDKRVAKYAQSISLNKERSEKIRQSKLGKKRKPFSKEWREKLSKAGKKRANFLRKLANDPKIKEINRQKHLGIKYSKETIQKRIRTLKKNPNWYKQRLLAIKKMRSHPNSNSKKTKQKRIASLKKLWKNKDFIKKVIRGTRKHPNRKEKQLSVLFQENNLPFTFVGNGSLIIGTKNPDFVHFYKKKLIEFNGDYWHSEKILIQRNRQTDKERKAYFARFGYETLIVTESQLEKPIEVIELVRDFERR